MDLKVDFTCGGYSTSTLTKPHKKDEQSNLWLGLDESLILVTRVTKKGHD